MIFLSIKLSNVTSIIIGLTFLGSLNKLEMECQQDNMFASPTTIIISLSDLLRLFLIKTKSIIKNSNS